MISAKTLISATDEGAFGKILNKLPILALLSIFLAAMAVSSIPNTHAVLTGTVCGFNFNTATACPAAPTNIVAAAGTNITVTFFIQGSDALNGVDMSVQSNPAILNPLLTSFCTGQSITGTNDCILVTNGPAVEPEVTIAGASVGGTADPNAMVTVNNVVKDNTSTTVSCSPATIVPTGTSTCTA